MGAPPVKRDSLALACLVLAIVANLALPAAQAQGPEQGEGITAPDGVVAGAPAFGPDTAPNEIARGTLDVICESILGAASSEEWQPLGLSNFFTEGWDDPYVRSPVGSKGAPKQNWFGAADGIFLRSVTLEFFYTNGLTTNQGLLLNPFPWAPVKPAANGNQYWASCNLYLPLNQRLELLLVAPFLASNKTSPDGHYVTNFGDLTISERFRLIEQQDFSFQAALTERMPTGQTVNGNDIAYITPAAEFWWNFAPKWVMRGSTGINIDTGRKSATDTYFNNVALGRYVTSKDARLFRSMVVHLAVSTMTDVLGRDGHNYEVYVAPGVRFGLDRSGKWYALGAVQVPVTGPHSYAYQLDFALSRDF
jgi:hypothetical protein